MYMYHYCNLLNTNLMQLVYVVQLYLITKNQKYKTKFYHVYVLIPINYFTFPVHYPFTFRILGNLCFWTYYFSLSLVNLTSNKCF